MFEMFHLNIFSLQRIGRQQDGATCHLPRVSSDSKPDTVFTGSATQIIKLFSFAFKIHLLEEYRNFYLLHMKKMEWFSKLSNEDRNHKAMLTKNKYKVKEMILAETKADKSSSLV